MPPRISVVIAAYAPGDAFDRVMGSLDAQTLPQDEFETIVVDDGSPDDTFARLSALASSRPNMRVERIENSGWPSRPRNVGVELARGEHVFFMDHDDSLYPDALRRMAEYAAETRADVLSPKESKTSSRWWAMDALEGGNRPNAVGGAGIAALEPMVPHKLYRRAFLAEHGIRFPEGRRRLWEDIFVNVEAWRHAERVAVLADTPAYLWHSSAGNNSRSYGPRDTEFWDRLDELCAFLDRTLSGPEHADARRTVLLEQYRDRVLDRLGGALQEATPEEAATALARARAIQERYVPAEWDRDLGAHVQARAALLRAGRADLLRTLWAIDDDSAAEVVARRVAWADDGLRLELAARWTDRAGAPVALLRDGDRLLRRLPEELLAALPADVVDVAGTIDGIRVRIGVRDRGRHVTWALPATLTVSLEDGAGGVVPVLTGSAVLDPAVAAAGAPLEAVAHDVISTIRWAGIDRPGVVGYGGRAAAATFDGRPAVAYRSQKGVLSLDLGAALRNPVADGGVPVGEVPGGVQPIVLPLPRLAVLGSAPMRGALRLTDAGREIVLPGTVVAAGAGAELRCDPHEPLPQGAYEIAFASAGGPFTGGRPARIRGGRLLLAPHGGALPAPTGLVGRLRDRIRPR